MSKFLVTLTVPMTVEFQSDEKPTERSAEYVATAIGLGYLSKDGTSRDVGWFRVYIDDPKKIVVVSSTRVDEPGKKREPNAFELARKKKGMV